MGEKSRGYLLLIGGAEDKKDKKEILKRFVSLARERESYLVILTSATSQPVETGQEYKTIFTEMGLTGIKILNINSREEAQQIEMANLIKEAGSIFFTGGDQLRITSIFGGTPVNRALKQVYEAGAIIAGTSAGASVVSDIMIIGGENDDTPGMRSVELAPGLGLLEEVVVDQHFAQRGRIGRLLMATAYNPYILGIGIDEDTAIEINNQAQFLVRGNGTVTILNGLKATHSNVFEVGDRQPLALLNIQLHILSAGYKFNLQTRDVIIPDE